MLMSIVFVFFYFLLVVFFCFFICLCSQTVVGNFICFQNKKILENDYDVPWCHDSDIRCVIGGYYMS